MTLEWCLLCGEGSHAPLNGKQLVEVEEGRREIRGGGGGGNSKIKRGKHGETFLRNGP